MTDFSPLMPHLIELRKRLIGCVIAFISLLFILMQFSAKIYNFFAKPLMTFLPENSTMIATEVASTFLTPFKLCFYISLFFCLPLLLAQFWRFIIPALYKHEKRMARIVLIMSVILFYLGVSFAYFFVMPIVFKFFVNMAPEGVQVMTDIRAYMDFVTTIFIAFGLAFQCPIVTYLLIWTGVTSAETMAKNRSYIIILSFTLGMLLTPPDVISQTLLAIPMWMLFESGVLLAKLTIPKEVLLEN